MWVDDIKNKINIQYKIIDDFDINKCYEVSKKHIKQYCIDNYNNENAFKMYDNGILVNNVHNEEVTMLFELVYFSELDKIYDKIILDYFDMVV